MSERSAWLIVAALAAASCGGELDCRHKGEECAEGFSCEGGGAGAWQCVKSTAQPAANKGRTDEVRPNPPPAPAEEPCPKHPSCAGLPAECVCGPGGSLLTRILDRDRDGTPDEKATYTNDAEGRPTQVIVDEGMDGSADSQHSYEYNDRGDPLAWQINRLTRTPDGAPDQRLTYEYDAQGRLVKEALDLSIDGTVDSTCTYSPPCAPPIPNPSCRPVCR